MIRPVAVADPGRPVDAQDQVPAAEDTNLAQVSGVLFPMGAQFWMRLDLLLYANQKR
jgi:hypothetical protein